MTNFQNEKLKQKSAEKLYASPSVSHLPSGQYSQLQLKTTPEGLHSIVADILTVEADHNQMQSHAEPTTPSKSTKSKQSPDKTFQTPKNQNNLPDSGEPYDPFSFSSKLKASQIETKKMSLSSTSSSSLSDLSKKVDQKVSFSQGKEKLSSPSKISSKNQKLEKKLDYSSYEEDFENSIRSKSPSSSDSD